LTAEHRAGFVALLGRPNAGKSSLMNTLIGERIAIVSHKAQTTRGRMLGVLTRPDGQIAFRDTPGVHRGQAKFNLAMTDAALESADGADVRAILFDCTADWDIPEERLAELPKPLVLVRTKRDLGAPTPVPDPERFSAIVEVSANSGRGIEELVTTLLGLLPVSPALYPEDYLTDAPLRFLAAEQIREVAFEMLRDELPYSLALEIEGWDERDGDVRIRANVLVERESKKGMVVGAGGRMLKALGTESRMRLSKMLDTTVHLALWVKTDKNWTKKPKRARSLGYL